MTRPGNNVLAIARSKMHDGNFRLLDIARASSNCGLHSVAHPQAITRLGKGAGVFNVCLWQIETNGLHLARTAGRAVIGHILQKG